MTANYHHHDTTAHPPACMCMCAGKHIGERCVAAQ